MVQPRGRAGQQNYEESTRWPFFFSSLRRKEEVLGGKTDEEKQKFSQNSLWLVKGGTVRRVYRERETKGGH